MKPIDFIRNGVSYTFTPLPDMVEAQVYETIPETKPNVVPTPGAGLKAAITSLEFGTMNVQYINESKDSATLKVRVGSTDRPDRIVPPGKTVVSTYTTTVKTGFAGQKITVQHAESKAMLLEKVL